MAKKQKTQTTEALPLVAIDLGSNGFRAMAAKRVGDDLLQILGVEESKKYPGAVQHGIIMQTSNAGYMIGEVLRLLANRIGVTELPTAFVTVGGRQVQIVPVFSKRDQVHKREVSQSLLEEMEQECKTKIEYRNPDVAVIGLVPSYYILDGQEQDNAPEQHQRAAMVEVHYIAFVGTKMMEEQLYKSFDQAGKSVEHSFVRQDALLSAFACADGSDILREGCAVLDLGAQTTTMSVYKGTEYLYHKVIPQGGYHLTRVIEQQGIQFATAEVLKCKYGFASAAQVKKNLRMSIPASTEVGGKLTITSEDLAYMLSMKLEEIINPLMDALKPFADRIRTLYITGGGAMLQGIDEYLQQKTRVTVQYGTHYPLLVNGVDERFYEPQYSALIGTLLLGADYRDTHKGEPLKRPGIWGKLGNTMIDIFTDPQQ